MAIRTKRILVACGFLFLAMAGPGLAHSAEATKPIQVALISPVQLVPPETSVIGLRLNLIYGVNRDVAGLDVGLVNQTTGAGAGLQYGLVGLVGSG